jgi:hypothetical protein
MGAIKKLFNKVRLKTRPGGGDDISSRAVTGIAPGDRGSNTGGVNNNRTIPGRRRPTTPLGPGRQQL